MTDPSTRSGQAQSPSLLNRLLAERRDAHRRYNEALTLLDRAIQSAPDFPAPPAAYDETLLPSINDTWEILPKAPAAAAGGVGAGASRSRWRSTPRWSSISIATSPRIARPTPRSSARYRRCATGFDALERFESLLLQFLQTITPLSDTHYREIDDAITQLRSVTDVAQRTAMLAKREVERAEIQVHRVHQVHQASAALGCIGCITRSTFNTSASKTASADPKSTIRARLADYVPYFAGQSNVLDVGCGRGEFLDLLREQGITAKGLDLNRGDGRSLPRRADSMRRPPMREVICRALPMNRSAD